MRIVSKLKETEAKVANTRYKPFAGLPAWARKESFFECAGRYKKIPIATASIAAQETDIDFYIVIHYLYLHKTKKRMAAINGS